MEKLDKALDELVSTIEGTKEYQNCLSIRDKMRQDEEICSYIERIKKLQKKVVQSNYDDSCFKELNEVQKELEMIPIYQIYLQNLEEVNQMIEVMKDSLNEYFDHLFL